MYYSYSYKTRFMCIIFTSLEALRSSGTRSWSFTNRVPNSGIVLHVYLFILQVDTQVLIHVSNLNITHKYIALTRHFPCFYYLNNGKEAIKKINHSPLIKMIACKIHNKGAEYVNWVSSQLNILIRSGTAIIIVMNKRITRPPCIISSLPCLPFSHPQAQIMIYTE